MKDPRGKRDEDEEEEDEDEEEEDEEKEEEEECGGVRISIPYRAVLINHGFPIGHQWLSYDRRHRRGVGVFPLVLGIFPV
ncbi:hypothetical protein M0802_004704 [Mischocyttarus mexicanus]|nr:hypothetical protein M0802_004704 [Mischocyttarus mexicanus]